MTSDYAINVGSRLEKGRGCMFSKIKNNFAMTIAAFALLLVPAFALAFAPSVSAVDIQDGICQGADQLQFTTNAPTAGACQGLNSSDAAINNLVTTAINVFSIVVGIVAVIMIIVGGLKYITSGGDSSKVTSAKNSIIYAIIGLIIVALAQVIVRFVLQKATSV